MAKRNTGFLISASTQLNKQSQNICQLVCLLLLQATSPSFDLLFARNRIWIVNGANSCFSHKASWTGPHNWKFSYQQPWKKNNKESGERPASATSGKPVFFCDGWEEQSNLFGNGRTLSSSYQALLIQFGPASKVFRKTRKVYCSGDVRRAAQLWTEIGRFTDPSDTLMGSSPRCPRCDDDRFSTLAILTKP